MEFRHNDIWNDDNSLKPRDKVYGQNIVPLAVVRRDDDIFLLIFTSNKTDFNKIKQTLRIDGTHGDVDPISSDLFTWLFYQFQMNEKMISDYMKIQQITGFLSTIGQDADSDSVSAKSGSVDTLSATKLEIALNHTLRSMELSIGLEEVNAKFTFDEKSFLLIDTAVTTLDNAFSKNYTGYNKEHSLMAQAVYIFAILLPLFEMEFGDDKVAFSGHVKTYRESLAKELVNKLLDAHPKLRENINQI
ncbi:hypothetical protein [Weissella cibaria]|uniref:hypothetical protein n=1 Tax=Weissella cibaria TaxID=137591 RepID=UPI0005BA8704|nr:hypothetical protein [Weissella cibaria]MDV8930413.1 hypothetical protein [Weissella cibaria]